MNRRWFQIHLSTAVVIMLLASALLGLNVYVITPHGTLWESGLPLFDWSRNAHYDGQLALHLPGVFEINISLNLLFCIGMMCGMEQHIRRREARAK